MLKNPGTRGSALVITLSIMVLIVGIVLAFFTRSSITRQVSFFSTSHYRADSIARTALDTITGDLRSEIVAGSTASPISSGTLYLPTSGSAILPVRVGDQGFVSLIKQSTAEKPFWTYTSVTSPIRAAAGNSTSTRSVNGRYINVNRWNKSGLLADPGTGATPLFSGTTPSGAPYLPPDWIVVTRRGAIADATSLPSMTNLSDKTNTNVNYALGRFAYMIYDEGGLLDVNVAGYPSTLASGTFSRERGLMPHVDLGKIAGVIDSDALVQWRNCVTAASSTTYSSSVLSSASNGFMKVASGDQAFVTRKDLIRYVQDHPGQVKTSALQYLGTFSRDLDEPAYCPDPARPQADDITNPNVIKIRVQKAFTRSDGTTAEVGDPLLKHRFPLARLALFQNPTANAALIKTYFAMKQGTGGLWNYYDPDTKAVFSTLPTIKTLDQVAAAGREPTFWELLQAGILAGSLGSNNGNAVSAFSTNQDANKTRQLLSIGLSIIDQYKADETPTVLNLGGTAPSNLNDLFVAGAQNAPYIFWIAQEHFQDNYNVLSPNTNAYVDGYLFFALWNPHRNASAATQGRFRIRCNGQTKITVKNSSITSGIYSGILTSGAVNHSNTTLTFKTTATRNFSQMSGLLPNDAILSSGNTSDVAQFPYPAVGTVAEVGILLGQIPFPKTPAIASDGTNSMMTVGFNQPLTIILEKQVGANWIPYQVFPAYQANAGNNGYDYAQVSTQLNKVGGFMNNGLQPPQATVLAFAHSDPRTSRFGLLLNASGAAQSMVYNDFNIIDNNTAAPLLFNNNSPTRLADYAYNTSATNHYADPDGLTRKADGNPDDPAKHGIYSPFCTASVDARPVMLHRPFASVAEMGYAFRDTPWRSLDFSSKDSADGGLLDLFCLNENTNTLRAGVLNLNRAHSEVLAAVLANAYRDPSSTDGTPLAMTDATTIAQAITTQLTSGSLVIKNAADLPLLADRISNSLPDRYKYKREAVSRSFADITNGRTWNLMVDVIAQSGRYAKNATSLNDFTVEGEQRYWLHLAIDRYTGTVLSQSLEQVTE